MDWMKYLIYRKWTCVFSAKKKKIWVQGIQFNYVKREALVLTVQVLKEEILYCKRIMFCVYDIWRKLLFEQCDYHYTYIMTFSDALDFAEAAFRQKC